MLTPHEGGLRVTALAKGALVVDGSAQIDLVFRSIALRPEEPFTVALGEATPILAMTSTYEATDRHRVGLRLREGLIGRVHVVATTPSGERIEIPAPEGADGSFKGGTTQTEPTSVHETEVVQPDGSVIIGIEYDYDLTGGTTFDASAAGVVSFPVARVGFEVVTGESVDAMEPLRLSGFRELDIDSESSRLLSTD